MDAVTGVRGGRLWEIPVDIGRDEARQRALEELAKSKYRQGLPPEVEGFLRKVLDLLERIVGWLVGSRIGQGGSGVNWGFAIAVIILLVALGLIIWRVGLPKWRRRVPRGGVQLDPTKPADDYRLMAEDHAGRGDWGSAVRDRFRAVVRELEVRTILDVRPARTAWEAAGSAARQLPDSQDALFAGAELFNDVMYGDRRPDAAAYAQMVSVDTAVTAAAERVDLAATEEAAVAAP